MAEPSEIKKAIREIVGAYPNPAITGTVKSVEGDSCTVVLKSGLTVSDVKLKATIGGNNYLLVTPKVDSTVVMLNQNGADNLSVVHVDEAEKWEYNQDGLNVLIDSTDGKVSIKNDGASLFAVLDDLAALLKKLKVSTPNGPSGTPLPPTIQAISKFETDLGKLLK